MAADVRPMHSKGRLRVSDMTNAALPIGSRAGKCYLGVHERIGPAWSYGLRVSSQHREFSFEVIISYCQSVCSETDHVLKIMLGAAKIWSL